LVIIQKTKASLNRGLCFQYKIFKIYYLNRGTPKGGYRALAAIFVEENGNDNLYYAYTDHLWSLTALTDKDGNVKERQAFDPWGNRRNPDDWTKLVTTPVSHITGWGYTMHEHLDDFALINMNGRVYDPQIAHFLSPDPQLQAPGYWLNYNRHGYCLNNPMIYTDPSGEFFWAALPLLAKIAIGVGAGVGAYSGYKIGDAKGASGLGMVGYMLGGAAVGGAAGWAGATSSAVALAGGGSTFNATITAGALAGMTSGAINGAGMTALTGGNMSDILEGITMGTVLGGFTGAVGGAVFHGMSQLTPKLIPKGILIRLLLDDIPMHNTVNYMVSSAASKMVANLFTGNKAFDKLDDIYKSPAILLPLFADIGPKIKPIIRYTATRHYESDPNIKVEDVQYWPGIPRSRMQPNGDLNLLSYIYGSNQKQDWWMFNGVFIPNYTSYALSIISYYK
jgi:RHS repeat-associated protein